MSRKRRNHSPDEAYPLDVRQITVNRLFFDSDAPHGPEELLELPARFLSIIIHHKNA